MKDWAKEKIATRKAIAALPGCSTPGCKGKAMGCQLGSALCPRCQQALQRGKSTVTPSELPK